MITKEQIIAKLASDDRWVTRAVLAITERQTADEKMAETTKYQNGRGWNGVHGKIGTSMAKFAEQRGGLTPKQIAYWRRRTPSGKMRIEIYAGQLLEIAKQKEAGA